jgi:molybdopterin-guanine dinucleotide biosynthesis protein A
MAISSDQFVGGIVLCGGRSTRMGSAKEWLPFGGETMLQRVVRVVAEAVGPVIVVSAMGQTLPELPAEVQVVHDRRPDRGPLEGLAAGLAALPATADAAFVTSVDAPLLTVPFVRRMIVLFAATLPEIEIVAPRIDGRVHPLTAVYRRAVLPRIAQFLAADRLRVTDLLAAAPTRSLAADELRAVDPELISLRNVNSPADYQAALRLLPDVSS